jgi:hypothetical protein
MIETAFWFVLVVYALFFVISIVKKDRILGVLASFLLLTLSIYVLTGGIQLHSGEIRTISNNTTNVVYQYNTELSDYYDIRLFGLTLLGISIYSLYRAFL